MRSSLFISLLTQGPCFSSYLAALPSFIESAALSSHRRLYKLSFLRLAEGVAVITHWSPCCSFSFVSPKEPEGRSQGGCDIIFRLNESWRNSLKENIYSTKSQKENHFCKTSHSESTSTSICWEVQRLVWSEPLACLQVGFADEHLLIKL